jgi:uncharacterized protein (TIGR02996 family)
MTEAEWQALLDASPADATARLVYADWLDEQGLSPEAEVQRWLARQGKYPYDWSKNEGYSPHDFDWYKEGGDARWDVPAYCTLPLSLWLLLGKGDSGNWASYRSRAGAEADLVTAWRKLREAGGSLPGCPRP